MTVIFFYSSLIDTWAVELAFNVVIITVFIIITAAKLQQIKYICKLKVLHITFYSVDIQSFEILYMAKVFNSLIKFYFVP